MSHQFLLDELLTSDNFWRINVGQPYSTEWTYIHEYELQKFYWVGYKNKLREELKKLIKNMQNAKYSCIKFSTK